MSRSLQLQRPPRRRLARLGCLVASFLFTLLLAEGVLRLLGVAYPNFYQVDSVRGWALRPEAEGRWIREGNGWVEINRAGWRERNLPFDKVGGTFRIAVLGDSMTEAMQVDAEATFPRLLEPRLLGCAALPPGTDKVEVLNFGVAGYGTGQEWLALQEEVWPYEPELVLLAFFPGNDVRNNSRALQQEGRRPYFLLSEQGNLELDSRFRQTQGYEFRTSLPGRLLYGLLDRSRLAQALKESWARIEIQRQRQIRTEGRQQESGLDPGVYRPPQDGPWEQAWRVTEALISAMAEDARTHGVRFALTSLTDGQAVHPDPEARQAAAEALELEDFSYPGRRLAAFAEQRGVPFLDLLPPMAQRAEETETFYHGFPNTAPGTGHWNEAGHATAAEVLAEWLCAALD